MNEFKIGIFDTKLKNEYSKLEDDLSAISSRFGIKVYCFNRRFRISADMKMNFTAIFLHISNYKMSVQKRWSEEFRNKCHLYWVSTDAQTQVCKPSDTLYEVRGVNYSLACANDYRKLNWEEALGEWRIKIDKWENKEGVIPPFSLDILTKKIDIFSRVEPLAALDILLQGYLAIRKPESIFGSDDDDFFDKYDILRGKTLEKALERTKYGNEDDQRLFRQKKDSKRKSAGWYWFDECLPDIKEYSFFELTENYEQLKSCKNLEKVWNLLRKECFEENDGFTIKEAIKSFSQDNDQDKLTNLFALAHEEYFELFEDEKRKKKALELEKIRSKLNHNEVKNNFLHRLESKNRNGSFEQRAEDINLVWADIRGEKISNKDLKSKIENICVALENWNSLYNSLKDFFEVVPLKFGYKFTQEGVLAKKDFFKGRNSYTKIIENFVKNFEEIAKQSEEERSKRLKVFFNAVDSIYKTLSSMSYEARDDQFFGGYLEPLD